MSNPCLWVRRSSGRRFNHTTLKLCRHAHPRLTLIGARAITFVLGLSIFSLRGTQLWGHCGDKGVFNSGVRRDFDR